VLESLREHKALPILGRALDMFDSHPAIKLARLFALRGFYASQLGQTNCPITVLKILHYRKGKLSAAVKDGAVE
jgi:hypothetical protein